MVINGKEKAFLGGLGAGITTFAGQLSVGGKLDVKTVAWSLGAWLVTHLFVYYATNTPVVEKVVSEVVAAADAPTPPVDPATP
jgi:hypothetical protein